MAGLGFALIFTLLRPGGIKALSQIWRGSFSCEAVWTISCAFIAGSFWGALSVLLCLLLGSRARFKVPRLDSSMSEPSTSFTREIAFSDHDHAPHPDLVALRASWRRETRSL